MSLCVYSLTAGRVEIYFLFKQEEAVEVRLSGSAGVFSIGTLV